MTAMGWLLMSVSCGAVISLTVYCYYRVLTTPTTTEHIHAPLEIDTQDTDT